MGILVKHNYIDIGFVDDSMGTPTIWVWEKLGPEIIDWRRRMNRPDIMEWFEYLYHQIKEYETHQIETLV